MIKLYGESNDPKYIAVKMFLDMKKINYKLLSDKDIPREIKYKSLPLLIKDDSILMEGYNPDMLSNLFT